MNSTEKANLPQTTSWEQSARQPQVSSFGQGKRKIAKVWYIFKEFQRYSKKSYMSRILSVFANVTSACQEHLV